MKGNGFVSRFRNTLSVYKQILKLHNGAYAKVVETKYYRK